MFSVTLLAILTLSSAALQGQGIFQPQCQSKEDYGWPRFQNQTELKVSPWSSYFMSVYGELPTKYPVCIYDFHVLDREAFIKAKITRKVVNATEVKNGDLYDNGGSYMIYHDTWEPLQDNCWVEIQHMALPTELQSYWVWKMPGSGVWYNIGKTKVFPTPANPAETHKEAIAWLTANCSKKPSAQWPRQESDIFGFCAREKGIDSLQFRPQDGQKPIGTFGQTGMFEIAMVNIDGQYNCGVPDASKTPLRQGWMASRQCDCINYPYDDSCGLMPRAPFPISIWGSDPPLCKKQQGPPFWNRWKKCNPATCRRTKCNVQKQPMADVLHRLPARQEIISV
jgi:hypothetical protein